MMSRTRFRPSSYGVSSAAAAAGGAVSAGDYVYFEDEILDEDAEKPAVLGAESTAAGGRHVSPTGFLGLNWRSIGAAVVVGTLVAVGTDLALEFIRPRIFGKKTSKEG